MLLVIRKRVTLFQLLLKKELQINSPQKKLIIGEDWNSYFRKTYGAENVRWKSAVSSIRIY
jgi:hypothetical protein